ncbi:MAG: hypothetical protein HFJ84_00855 [Clostridiales bacterium]|jgi:hypothetical protein|nr:hypothetical protein [Clostridiales bacterium]
MSKEKRKDASTDLLQELYHTAQMGLEATQMVMPKVKDEGLKHAIRQQGNSYKKISAKSAQMLAQNHQIPQKEGVMEKVGLWGSIQMNTIADDSTQHLAEMMINGTNMGIVDMTKKLNETEGFHGTARDLAEEYIQSEQNHIESMKQYL